MNRFMINNAGMFFRPALRRSSLAALASCSALLWLAGCAQKSTIENVPPPPSFQEYAAAAPDGHNAQNALDWEGTYQAVLPCLNCPGTAISVQLRKDMTATVRERRLGSPTQDGVVYTYQGPFSFGKGEHANLIALAEPNAQVPAYRFFVSEGWIELRERATGAKLSQGTMYRLRQTTAR